MKQLDTYYRALMEYKRITGSNAECETFLHALSDAESAFESIELTRTVCTVDEDWIEKIEDGLVHIANAIREERQFILSEGGVVPIEKAKSVSVESVKHLAKHSNLISRAPIDGEIIPDSIYTVERLNDYTVYENRFLYMLLCYLRDFISIRLDKIVEFSYKYEGSLSLNKVLDLGGRRVSYRIDLTEVCKNHTYLRDHSENKNIIERISLIFRTVLSLLSTPLMEDVAKASMLKPPITKTNVLKMDKHFRGAVELYDYIMAYGRPGYTTKEEKRIVSPFDDELSGDIAAISSALSFITYENTLDIKSDLAHRYEVEEEHKRAEEIKRYGDQISQIKLRMQNGEIEAAEYIHTLEKRFGALEAAYENTEIITEKLGAAEREIFSLRAQNTVLDAKNNNLEEELEADAKRHLAEKEALKAEYDQKLSDATAEHLQETSALENTYRDELAQIHQRLKQALQENDMLQEEKSRLLEEKLVADARMKAILYNGGENVENYTDKEKFDQLEKEYEAFTRFYKSQWKKAKKEIRKSLLNFEALRGQKGDSDE